MRDVQLSARMYNTPLMLHPGKAAVLESVLAAHMRGETMSGLDPKLAASERPQIEARYSSLRWRPRDGRPYALTESGIAVLPVMGTLMHRAGMMDAWSGLCSYESINADLAAAIDSGEVRGVLQEYDSHGGEVFGCNELAQRIIKARSIKPIWSFINEQCYSAGYFLACSTDRKYLPKTGQLGSIGTIALHQDRSRADEAEGVTYTYIYDGDYKKDLNSHEPIGDGPRSRLQSLVTRHGLIFRAHVAEMQGLTLEQVTATKAGTLHAEAAVELGFADGIASFEETIALFEAHLDERQQSNTGTQSAGHITSTPQENQMETKKPAGAPTESAEAKHTDAQLEAAVTQARTEGHAAGVTEGRATGITAERERINAILGSPEAKGRATLATTFATRTDMTAEQAIEALKVAPKEQGGNVLVNTMAALKNPDVGAEAAAVEGEAAEAAALAQSIVALHQSANGIKQPAAA